MKNKHLEELLAAKATFVNALERGYNFPAGGQVSIMTPAERVLYISLDSPALSVREKINSLASELNFPTQYSLAIFSIRLAILAVRNSDSAPYRLGLLPLAACCPQLDWRDGLKVFVILEDCGSRIGISLQREIELVAANMDSEVLRPSIDSYFSRAPEWRTLDVLGAATTGSGDTFSYYTY